MMPYPKNNTSAIILAAGTSTRMGTRNKLLLPLSPGGLPLIRVVVERVLASNCGEIIVVLGHEKEKVKAVLEDLDIRFATNPMYRSGMTSSIQSGVGVVHPDSAGVLICLGDMPLLNTEDYNRVTEAVTGAPQIIVPVFEGQNGHPVFFSHHFISDILAHDQPEGCKSIVSRNKDRVTRIAGPNSHILKDIDLPEDYHRLLKW